MARDVLARVLGHAGDGAHQIVFGEDVVARVAHFDEHRGTFVA